MTTRFVAVSAFVLLTSLLLNPALNAARFYVDAGADPGGDGSSWATAFQSLQDALAETVEGRGDEVWIAAGTYYPDQGASVTSGDREATFRVQNRVHLYGGFAGGENSLDARDWEANETILSGEIFEQQQYWSLTVVTVDGDAVLDGLTVTRGNANGPSGASANGGGVYVEAGSPTIRNCRFVGNRGTEGGAIWGRTGEVRASFFEENHASREGGAIFINRDDSVIANTVFRSNSASSRGGAIYHGGQGATIANSVFQMNSAAHMGGALFLSYGSIQIVNSVFVTNSAAYGGAVGNSSSESTFMNSTFYSNSATVRAGAIEVSSSGRVTIKNSLLWNNTAPTGPQFYVLGRLKNATAEFPTPLTPRAPNLIEGGMQNIEVAGDGEVDFLDASTYVLTGFPFFVAASSPAGADGVFGTRDDGLRLREYSAARNAGNAELLPRDAHDLDGDGDPDELLPIDLAGFLRVQGENVDLGAYEYGDEPNIVLPVREETVAADGDEITVTLVATPLDTGWTVVDLPGWIDAVNPSGAGSAAIVLQIDENPSVSERSAVITIAGEAFTVVQEAMEPEFGLVEDSAAVGPDGGAVTVLVEATPADAPWDVSGLPEWVGVSDRDPGLLMLQIEGVNPEGGAFRIDEAALAEGVSGPDLVLEGAGEADAGLYSAVVSNPEGEAISEEAALVVSEAMSSPGPHAPPQIVNPPQHRVVNEGEPARFAVAAAGEGLSYQWRWRAGLASETTSVLQGPHDLLVNGDFSGDFQSNGVGEAWSVISGTAWEAEAAEGYAGGTAQRFHWSAKTSWGPFLFQNPGFVQGESYEIFMRYRTAPGTRVSLQVSDPAFRSWSRMLVERDLSTDGEWEEVTYTFTVDVPSGEDPNQLGARIEGDTLAGGTVWIDEVQVRPLDAIDSAELILDAVTDAEAGRYSVAVSNAHGEVVSQEAVLLVNPAEPAPTTLFAFEEGENPFSGGTITEERSYTGNHSLYLGPGDEAVLDIPALHDDAAVTVNMKIFDPGLWIDRENSGYPESVYGPRWGVSTDPHDASSGSAQPAVGVSITERSYLPAGSGSEYTVQGHPPDNVGHSRFAESWFGVYVFPDSDALRQNAPWLGDGGSVVNGVWQPPQPGEGTWLDVTFEVAADGEVVVTMVDLSREVGAVMEGRTIGGSATQVWLYGGRDHPTSGHPLAGIWVDRVEISGPAVEAGPIQAPQIVAQPHDQVVEPGGPARFTVPVEGEELRYSWRVREGSDSDVFSRVLPGVDLLVNGNFGGGFDLDGVAQGWGVLSAIDWEAGADSGTAGGTAQRVQWPAQAGWGPVLHQTPGLAFGREYELFLRYRTDPGSEIDVYVATPSNRSGPESGLPRDCRARRDGRK